MNCSDMLSLLLLLLLLVMSIVADEALWGSCCTAPLHSSAPRTTLSLLVHAHTCCHTTMRRKGGNSDAIHRRL